MFVCQSVSLHILSIPAVCLAVFRNILKSIYLTTHYAQPLSVYDYSTLKYVDLLQSKCQVRHLSVAPLSRYLTHTYRAFCQLLRCVDLSSGSTLKLRCGLELAGLELCHIVLQRTRFNCRPFQAFQATGAAPRRGDCFPFPWHFQLAANSLLSAHNDGVCICTYVAYLSCIYGIYTCSYVPDNCGAACP